MMETETKKNQEKIQTLFNLIQQTSKYSYTIHNEDDLSKEICKMLVNQINIQASWILLTDENSKITKTYLAGKLDPEYESLYPKTNTCLIKELYQILNSRNKFTFSSHNEYHSNNVLIFPIFHKTNTYGLLFIATSIDNLDECERNIFRNIPQIIGEAICRIRHQCSKTDSINQELTESGSLIEMLIDSIPSGFLMIGEDYKIYKVNKQTCLSTGYTKEQLLGNYCDMICPKGPVSKECPVWAKGLRSFKGMDTFIKGVNNKMTPIFKNAQIIEIHGKKYILESFLDITNLKNTENELIKAKERAEESDKLKTTFLANMSHEIRTPVNAIMGLSEVLMYNKYCLSENPGYLDVIKKSADRMINTISDIVNISKIQSDLVELNYKKIDLLEFFNQIYSFFKPQLAHTDIVLLLELDKNIHFYSDPEKLNVILINLLKNSMKFTTSGYIKFGYKIENSNIVFFVKDTGIGIKKEYQKLIFERFVQADNSSSKRYEGSGLGLSIAKSYTELLGGKIILESEPEVGSTFYVTIPNNSLWPD